MRPLCSIGLSPRVRGSLVLTMLRRSPLRSIPASAGQPVAVGVAGALGKVYPRECGAAASSRCRWYPSRGLSPRVRGSLVHGYPGRVDRRSIPASAGQPIFMASSNTASGVYPRECGAAWAPVWLTGWKSGLSPRVRGSHEATKCAVGVLRSIPASAGQPLPSLFVAMARAVYPRECGAAGRSQILSASSMGLSPRVRGSRWAAEPELVRMGSIPASAGQPTPSGTSRFLQRVYPRECGAAENAPGDGGSLIGLSRECGAARRATTAPATPSGLSPRVRGSHRLAVNDKRRPGSIPASAGQPADGNHARNTDAVYPRECGAAYHFLMITLTPRGLSPRVRGSRKEAVACDEPRGSIPASAGQPHPPAHPLNQDEVYPRECGAACFDWLDGQLPGGLSPRVRGSLTDNIRENHNIGSIPASAGSLPRRCRAKDTRGSIPASAGQPVAAVDEIAAIAVYPRECGAAVERRHAHNHGHGLSPRVRGSRPRGVAAPCWRRSIPASAGQPHPVFAAHSVDRVYPRECGAAYISSGNGYTASGLSPRVRGSQVANALHHFIYRSIPASAGQPCQQEPTHRSAPVYPRECGAAGLPQGECAAS